MSAEEDNKLHELLLEKLEKLLENIENRSKSREDLKEVFHKLKEEHDVLKNIVPPYIISKEQINAVAKIIKLIQDFNNILEQSDKIIFEELYVVARDLVESLNTYVNTLKRERLKTLTVFYAPIYLAFVIFLANFIVYIGNDYLLITHGLMVIIGAIAILLTAKKPKKLEASYVLVIIAGIIGIISISYEASGMNTELLYTDLVYILIVLSATTYFQLIRTIFSSNYQEKIKKILSEIFIVFDQNKKQEEINNELLEEARKTYRKLYGEIGDKYLSYKLTLLTMHGYSKDKALEKIVDELRRSGQLQSLNR